MSETSGARCCIKTEAPHRASFRGTRESRDVVPAAAGCLHTSGSRVFLGAERPGSRTVDLEAWADEQVAPLLLTLCSFEPFASRQTD